MDILYQYYNEVVLAFNDYEVELKDQTIVIEVPESGKPFASVCEKILAQLIRIEESLDPRNREVSIQVIRGKETKGFLLTQNV